MHPDSLHRLVLIGVNHRPLRLGSSYPRQYDRSFQRAVLSGCYCSSRTSDLAQTMYEVNHNMAGALAVFQNRSDTVRLGTLSWFLDNRICDIFDAYLAAQKRPFRFGDDEPDDVDSPIDQQIFGDQASKAGTLDLESRRGREASAWRIRLWDADARMDWPMVREWPIN